MNMLRKILIVIMIVLTSALAKAEFNLNPETGIGEWQKLPFADVRLLSCLTGTKNRSMIVGGMQVKVYSGWSLKKPNLFPIPKDSIAKIEYPIRPDPMDTTTYEDSLFIPVIYAHYPKQRDFHFGIQGDLQACHEKKCLTTPISLELPMDENDSQYTSACAFIMDQMQQIPMPGKTMGMYGYVQKIGQDQFMLQFFGLKGLEQAFLQNQSGVKFEVLEMQLVETGVQFLVRTSSADHSEITQGWILLTNRGIFRLPLTLTEEEHPLRTSSVSWLKLLLYGFILFICSPFFIFWGTVFPKTSKQLQKQCLKTMCFIPVILGAWICFQSFVPQEFYLPLLPYIVGLMILTLFLPPRFLWWTSALFIIWPVFYLSYLFEITLWQYLFIFLLIALEVPFAILYRHASFWQKKAKASLKKGFFCHNLFFLLPTMLLIGWSINFLYQNTEYQNDTLSNDKVNVVCLKENCSKWGQSDFQVQFIDPHSILGENLQKLYGIHKQMVIFYDGPVRTILSEITPSELKRYLIGLHNYRAGYKPKSQPVHSEDVLHAPSPNAR